MDCSSSSRTPRPLSTNSLTNISMKDLIFSISSWVGRNPSKVKIYHHHRNPQTIPLLYSVSYAQSSGQRYWLPPWIPLSAKVLHICPKVFPFLQKHSISGAWKLFVHAQWDLANLHFILVQMGLQFKMFLENENCGL